jgi:hypothetical protein
MLDHGPRLTAEQQAQWVATLHAVEYHEADLPSDWLGAGLWIAYAALALLWCRSVAWREKMASVWPVRATAAIPQIARRSARPRETVTQLERPCTRLFPEPSAVQI